MKFGQPACHRNVQSIKTRIVHSENGQLKNYVFAIRNLCIILSLNIKVPEQIYEFLLTLSVLSTQADGIDLSSMQGIFVVFRWNSILFTAWRLNTAHAQNLIEICTPVRNVTDCKVSMEQARTWWPAAPGRVKIWEWHARDKNRKRVAKEFCHQTCVTNTLQMRQMCSLYSMITNASPILCYLILNEPLTGKHFTFARSVWQF